MQEYAMTFLAFLKGYLLNIVNKIKVNISYNIFLHNQIDFFQNPLFHASLICMKVKYA